MTISSQDDEQPLVLVDADLGWWRPLELFRRLQSRWLDALQLDSSRFLFALTHTHAAAPLMDPDPSLPGSDMQASWLESIYDAVVQGVHESLASSFEATIDWHYGRCGLAKSRDFPDPSGDTQRFLCGYNPDAPADDTLLIGCIGDRAGRLRAMIVNYACHPTTLAWQNRAISPDYPGAMRATIEADGPHAFFLQGASGDLAPRHQYVGDTEVADQHGRQLAYAALATLEDMDPAASEFHYAGVVESGAPLAVWSHRPVAPSTVLRAAQRSAELDLKDWPSAAELEQQRQACDDRAMEERLRRRRDIRHQLGDGDHFPVPVHAWRIGDAVIIGCCCEPYSQLQVELRRRFPDHAIACVNLLNGSIGYLPPAGLYDDDVYPVWQTPFARGGLEKMIEAMTATVEELLT